MARIKPSEKKHEAETITPKPSPASSQPTKPKPQATITPKKAPEPKPEKATEQPKRRTLQDRRPALKDTQEPVEHRIVTKPIYGKRDSLTTKRISETKEVVIKPISEQKQGRVTAKLIRPKEAIPLGKEARVGRVTQARIQQERAIDEARAAYTTEERENADIGWELERKKREQEETSYRLNLDKPNKYSRKG